MLRNVAFDLAKYLSKAQIFRSQHTLYRSWMNPNMSREKIQPIKPGSYLRANEIF